MALDIWKLCGMALLIAVSALLVRQNNGEYGKVITVCGGVLLTGLVLHEMAPVIQDVLSLPGHLRWRDISHDDAQSTGGWLDRTGDLRYCIGPWRTGAGTQG